VSDFITAKEIQLEGSEITRAAIRASKIAQDELVHRINRYNCHPERVLRVTGDHPVASFKDCPAVALKWCAVLSGTADKVAM
jgi:hypothetical protein